jgi:3',5'-cyclic AMP phosphodiesterase CpdA
MRIAQISDFHFTHLTWNPLRLFSKRFLGNLNWLFFRKGHFSEKLLEPLPSFFQELGVDLVLVGGDLSTTSLAEEFQKGALFLKQLNLPWIAIPGNHDKYTYRSCRKQHFYRYFANKRKEITDPVEFFTLQKHGVEVHKIGKGWYVVALDTTLATNPYSSEGIISQKLQDYLDEALQLIPEDASILMLNHYPFFQNDVSRHALKRGKSLQKQIERHPRIKLYLHGHTHRHTIANLQENNLPIVLDGGSCSAGKRASFNIIDLHPDRCEISAYFWQSGWTKTRTEEFLWTRN